MRDFDNFRRFAEQQPRIQEFAELVNRILENQRAVQHALEIPNVALDHLRQMETVRKEVLGRATELEAAARRALEVPQGPLDHLRQIEDAVRPMNEIIGRATEAERVIRQALEAPQGALEHLRQIEDAVRPMKEAIDRAMELERASAPLRSTAEQILTIQEAANHLLRESEQALSAREIAESALSRQLVYSSARDPINSLAQTLEKNIREEVYNNPPLKFVRKGGKRFLALPEWTEPHTESSAQAHCRLTIDVSPALVRDLRLAVEAGLAETAEEALALFARRGLTGASDEIKRAIIAKLEQFGSDDSQSP